jgi:hypothetical protein
MEFSVSQLWRTSGTVGRGHYAVIGCFGFAIKHNLDRFVAAFFFNRPWDLLNYWFPVREVIGVTQLPHEEQVFLATMVAIALPFVWVGVSLTMQRLRSAGLPDYLIALFFIPFVNLPFFLILSLVPERAEHASSSTQPHSILGRVIPESAPGSAAISLLITVPVGLGFCYLGTHEFVRYGWGLFVAIPFTMGFGAVLLYGLQRPRSFGACMGVASLSVALLGAGLLGLAVEGVACLIMALPLALPLALIGGACGYVVQKRHCPPQKDAPIYLSALLLLVPGVQGIEHLIAAPAPVFMVRSALDINAPPEKVWKEVVAFTQIPEPTEWIFRAGIAYPIRAEMIGAGPGAERHCVFSTGAFVEPIQVWDEPHLLKFSVTSNPPPMEEWTPYSHIEPPHLHGYLESEGGQFRLTPLPNGGTRLEGTTWYHHGLWPTTYWRVWSDAIIHQIHMRVLRHIRDEAEGRIS